MHQKSLSRKLELENLSVKSSVYGNRRNMGSHSFLSRSRRHAGSIVGDSRTNMEVFVDSQDPRLCPSHYQHSLRNIRHIVQEIDSPDPVPNGKREIQQPNCKRSIKF